MVAPFYEGAIVIGAFLGVIIIAGTMVFIQRIEWTKLKQFFWRQDDTKRESIMKNLDDIHKDLEKLANETNSAYCRRQANSILDVMTFLKKHRLN